MIQVFNVQLYLGQSSQLTSIFFRRAPTSLVLLTILDPDDHFEESQCSHHFRQSKEWEYELHAQLLTLLMLCAADNIAQSCPSVTKKNRVPPPFPCVCKFEVCECGWRLLPRPPRPFSIKCVCKCEVYKCEKTLPPYPTLPHPIIKNVAASFILLL